MDYEKQKTHSLVVEAKDKGGLSTSTLVNVAVVDVNDNIPEFLPSVYMAKITQNTASIRGPHYIEDFGKQNNIKLNLRHGPTDPPKFVREPSELPFALHLK